MKAGAGLIVLVAIVAIAAGCTRGSGSSATPAEGSSAIALAGSAPGPGAKAGAAPVIDFLSPDAVCTFGHRGVLLDLGDASMRARMTQKLARVDVETREHEGATWAGIHERQIGLSFVSPAPVPAENGLVVEARMRGGLAKSVSVYLDQKLLGTLPLTKGEAKVVSLHAPGASIARGANELLLRFVGGTRASHDTLAEVDWVRVGAADGDAPYAAPTRSDAVTTATIGGVAHRGLSLRAPGFARCSSFVPNGAVLEGFVGASGGEADAEVRVLVDRAEPRVVGAFHLGGEGSVAWRPVSLPLGEVGSVASVELVAKQSAKGARVVFAEPRIVPASTPPPPTPPPTSKGVVLVILGSAPPKMLSPWGGTIATPELAQLGSGGMVFEAHRATSSLASPAVASMLTGLLPRDHGVSEADAVLATNAITIAEAARQGGVVTAMFTANPTTSATFGFARGWETFVAHAPNEDAPATAVFDDAAKWLDLHKDDRFLLVVHARGGHPPWDAAAEELKDLPPAGYSGGLDPKHAGEMLAKARRSGSHSLSDADRERALALHARAIGAHDAALGSLVAHLRTLGRDGDTTILVTGDVGVDTGSHVPFLEDEPLDENALALPLVVRAPGNPPRARVAVPTSGVDVARTALEALGLPAPQEMRGVSLWAAAQRTRETAERPTLAMTTLRLSARWGAFVLVGAREREGKLCNLSLEADCVGDVRPTHPLAAEALHAFVWDELVANKTATPPTRATIDPPTAAALRAWGR